MSAHSAKIWIGATLGGMALALAATPSLAQDPWYASITGNAVFLDDASFSTNVPGLNGQIDYDTDWGADGALGYDFGNGLRAEGEVGYRSNDIDSININGLGMLPGSGGDVDLWTGLANVYYDIDLGSPLVPYIGGGIGIARYSTELTVAGIPGSVKDNDTVFAYQVSAGVGYAITPSTTIFGGYRYLATDDPDISDAGVTASTEYQSHNAQVGVRFGF